KRSLSGNAAGRTLHRFDQDRRQRGAVRLHQFLDCRQIIVAAEQIIVRRIEPATMAAKIKYPAMIASPEYQYVRPPRGGARSAARHQIGLGAGIREAHELDRWEPRADRRRETRLERVVCAEIETAVERRLDRAADRRMRMAVNPGRKLAEEIDIFVP